MDRKMGMERWQAENLVSQAKQKLRTDLLSGKVGLDRAYSLVNSMKMVESQWQKMAGSQPQGQNAGQAGGSQPQSQNIGQAGGSQPQSQNVGQTGGSQPAASQDQEKTILTAHPQKYGQGFLDAIAGQSAEERVITAHPQQYGNGFLDAAGNAAKLFGKTAKDINRENRILAVRLDSFSKGKSWQEAGENAQAFRAKLEEQDREKEAKKQAKQTLKNNWQKDQQAMLEDLSPEDQNILKELSRVEYDLDHGLDRSYENVFQNQLLRDSYRKSLDVHGIRGKDLEEMVRYLQMLENEQRDLQAQQERRDFADDGFLQGIGASILSVPETIVGGILGTIDTGWQYAERRRNHSYAPLDIHTPIQSISNQAQAGRQEVGSNLNQWADETTGSDLTGDMVEWLYHTGMSAADIAATVPLGPAGAAAVNGAVGFNADFKQARQQGANDQEALAYAGANQVVGLVFDKLGATMTKKLLSQNGEVVRDMIAQQLKQIKDKSIRAVTNQAVENALERIFLTDSSTLEKTYEEAYRKAMQQGANQAQAKAAGLNAQKAFVFKDALAAVPKKMIQSGSQAAAQKYLGS